MQLSRKVTCHELPVGNIAGARKRTQIHQLRLQFHYFHHQIHHPVLLAESSCYYWRGAGVGTVVGAVAHCAPRVRYAVAKQTRRCHHLPAVLQSWQQSRHVNMGSLLGNSLETFNQSAHQGRLFPCGRGHCGSGGNQRGVWGVVPEV